MPNVTVKIPLSSSPLTFATRARRRAGLGMFLAPDASQWFPAGPHFSRGGLGGLFSKPPAPPVLTRVGGPIVCPRGLESFFSKKLRVPLPAREVFSPYWQGEKRGLGAFRSFRRGMGDAQSDYANEEAAYQAAQATPGSISLQDAGFFFSDAPTYTVPSDLGGIVVSPTPTAPTAPDWTPGGTYNPGNTNAQLTAFNQALTNAQANNPTLSSASVLSSLGTSIATATPAQLTQATAALNAQAAPTASSWLSGSTILSGFTNGTVLFGGAAIAVLVGVLASAKKGKR